LEPELVEESDPRASMASRFRAGSAGSKVIFRALRTPIGTVATHRSARRFSPLARVSVTPSASRAM